MLLHSVFDWFIKEAFQILFFLVARICCAKRIDERISNNRKVIPMTFRRVEDQVFIRTFEVLVPCWALKYFVNLSFFDFIPKQAHEKNRSYHNERSPNYISSNSLNSVLQLFWRSIVNCRNWVASLTIIEQKSKQSNSLSYDKQSQNSKIFSEFPRTHCRHFHRWYDKFSSKFNW